MATLGELTVELTASFDAERYQKALESWTFLDLSGKKPIFTSLFGDVFFESPQGIWWLDTLEGTLSRPWKTLDELRSCLDSPEGQDRYLLGGLAHAAAARGPLPSPSQVFSFRIAPIIGGPISPDNVEVADFVVALNILGQIHAQVRGQPPGSRIARVSVNRKA